jgi:hypothetical protein
LRWITSPVALFTLKQMPTCSLVTSLSWKVTLSPSTVGLGRRVQVAPAGQSGAVTPFSLRPSTVT